VPHTSSDSFTPDITVVPPVSPPTSFKSNSGHSHAFCPAVSALVFLAWPARPHYTPPPEPRAREPSSPSPTGCRFPANARHGHGPSYANRAGLVAPPRVRPRGPFWIRFRHQERQDGRTRKGCCVLAWTGARLIRFRLAFGLEPKTCGNYRDHRYFPHVGGTPTFCIQNHDSPITHSIPSPTAAVTSIEKGGSAS
jgi:hypothetical protein